MTDQDKRAVEGLARCGISLERLCNAFPQFPIDEVQEIYRELHQDYGLWMMNKLKVSGG